MAHIGEIGKNVWFRARSHGLSSILFSFAQKQTILPISQTIMFADLEP